MRYLIETGFDVRLQHPMIVSRLAGVVMNLGHRVLRAPVRTNPYEQGLKSASKMGSSTSFRLAWTTRSVMVGIPSFRNFPVLPLGIITRRTATGRNTLDLSASRIWARKA
jgi:hypothetical protein